MENAATALSNALNKTYQRAPRILNEEGMPYAQALAEEPRMLSLGLGSLNSQTTQDAIDLKTQQDLFNQAITKAQLDATDATLSAIGGGSSEGYNTPYGLEPSFWERIGRANAAMKAAGLGTFSVSSGYRTRSQQAALYKQKPGLAAPPGKSRHEKGMAVDLNLSKAQVRWLQQHAKEYGLYQPMSYEPWHWQPR